MLGLPRSFHGRCHHRALRIFQGTPWLESVRFLRNKNEIWYPRDMALLRNWLLLGVCGVSGACASTSGPASGAPGGGSGRDAPASYASRGNSVGRVPHGEGRSAPTQKEWNQLNERVRFLERRLSDMDVKIALMAERVESSSGGQPAKWSDAPNSESGPPLRPEPAVIEILPSPEETPGLEAADALSPEPALAFESAENRLTEEPESSFVQNVARDTSWAATSTAQAVTVPEMQGQAAHDLVSVEDAADVKGAYNWAQRQRRAENWQAAERVFSEIYRKFPSHSLGDNALYWLGVVQAARGGQRQAIQTFAQVPVRFPNSPKIADALYGMARAHEALGEPLLAEVLYRQLVEEYPRAERRGDAKRALVRLTHPNP